jgi:hypothetical protein
MQMPQLQLTSIQLVRACVEPPAGIEPATSSYLPCVLSRTYRGATAGHP